MNPATRREQVIQMQLLSSLDDLYKARASRLSAIESRIPYVMWLIIVSGGILTVGFTYLFGFRDFRMQIAMTTAVAASLSLVVVLIVAFDLPFRGAVSISPFAFIKTEKLWNALPLEETPAQPL